MSNVSSNWHKHLAVLAALTLGAALQACAQGRGGFPGGGGGGGGGRGGASSTSPYPTSTTIPDAYFSIDPESRRVFTISDEETSRALSLVISNLDRPKPQVLINVLFLEVIHNNASDIGIEGGWSKQFQNNGPGNTTTASGANGFGLGNITSISTNFNAFGQPISSFAQQGPMSSAGAGLYQIMGQNYQATLRAIAQAGSVKVLSRPTILGRNNQPATIFVGELVPIVNNVRYDNFGNVINSIQQQQVGVVLNVTPFITSQGLVEMIVSSEISAIDPTLSVPISASASVPVIDQRSANTVAVTPDGETVIIGGLMEDDKTVNVIKIPFLGDIPVLGNLFRRTQKSTAKTELMIFLTPHIAQAPAQLVALTEQEKQRSDGPKAFTEKELDKFLQSLPPQGPRKDTHKGSPRNPLRDRHIDTPRDAPRGFAPAVDQDAPRAVAPAVDRDAPRAVTPAVDKDAPKNPVPTPSPAIDNRGGPSASSKDGE